MMSNFNSMCRNNSKFYILCLNAFLFSSKWYFYTWKEKPKTQNRILSSFKFEIIRIDKVIRLQNDINFS